MMEHSGSLKVKASPLLMLFLAVGEDAGIVAVPVVRRAGSLGVVSAQVASKGLSATSGLDFSLENVSVVFADGQNASQINVTIIDDFDGYDSTS